MTKKTLLCLWFMFAALSLTAAETRIPGRAWVDLRFKRDGKPGQIRLEAIPAWQVHNVYRFYRIESPDGKLVITTTPYEIPYFVVWFRTPGADHTDYDRNGYGVNFSSGHDYGRSFRFEAVAETRLLIRFRIVAEQSLTLATIGGRKLELLPGSSLLFELPVKEKPAVFHFTELLIKEAGSADGKRLYALCKHGARINGRDREGRTALSRAVEAGNYHNAFFLLADMQADPNIRDNRGRTPLFYLTGKQAHELGVQLVLHGALTGIRDHQGESLVDVLRKRGLHSLADWMSNKK